MQELNPEMIQYGDACDESKCVSKGMSYLYEDSFTCFGNDGILFPMMCADGFLPVIVEDEPPQMHTTWWGPTQVSYFTCCPPQQLSSNTTDDAVSRQCSDPITVTDSVDDGDSERLNSLCNTNETQKYRRDMKSSRGMLGFGTLDFVPTKTDSFLCCDSLPSVEDSDENSAVVATNFLNNVECVPYRNEFYESKPAQNLIGILRVISCDFPEGDFVFPRPMPGQDYSHVVASGQYQCCKEGPALPPFIQDKAFKTTVYPVFFLMCISAVVSAIIAISLLIPLIIQLKNGRFGKRDSGRKTSSSMRSKKEPCYSTFNLYVVYLSFSDLLFCLFQLGCYASYMNQKFNPRFHSIVASPTNLLNPVTIVRADGPFTLAYTFVNMWINAIISYQLLILLRDSQRGRRISQPSLRKVNLQVGAVFLLAVIYASILYVLKTISWRAGNNFDFETVNTIAGIVKVTWKTMVCLPIVFLVTVGFLIWWGGYISKLDVKSSAKDRAMWQLVLFFLRIVAVFFVIWFPSLLLVIFGVMTYKPWYFILAWSLLAIQPILSACVVLTKYDVRKYVYDLITLSYLRKRKRDSSVSQRSYNSYKFGSGNSQRDESCNTSTFRSNGSHMYGISDRNDSSKSYRYDSSKVRFSIASGIGVSSMSEMNMGANSDTTARDSICFSVLGFVPEKDDEGSKAEDDAESILENGSAILLDDDASKHDADAEVDASTDVDDSATLTETGITNEENTGDKEEVSEHEIVFTGADREDDRDPSQLFVDNSWFSSTEEDANPQSPATAAKEEDKDQSDLE